jgi:hypothetical protein
MAATSITLDTALRGLVATAGAIRDVFKPDFLEPIARCGGGKKVVCVIISAVFVKEAAVSCLVWIESHTRCNIGGLDSILY